MNFFKRGVRAAKATVTDGAKALVPKNLKEVPSKLFVAPLTTPFVVAARNAKNLGVGGKVGELATVIDKRATAAQVIGDENPATVVKGVGAVAATVGAYFTAGATLPLAAKLGASVANDVAVIEGKDAAAQDEAKAAAVAAAQPAAPELTFWSWLFSLGKRS